MSTPLDLSTYQRPDGTWVITVAGEVDISNAGAFQEGLAQGRARAAEGQRVLLVDLRSGTSTRPGLPACLPAPRESR